MNYITLPKNKFNIIFNPQFLEIRQEPFISNSLNYYLNKSFSELQLLKIDSYNQIEDICKLINTYYYINNTIEDSVNSISKINFNSNFEFEIIEIIYYFNLHEKINSGYTLNFTNYPIYNLFSFLGNDNKQNDNFKFNMEQVFYRCILDDFNSSKKYIFGIFEFYEFEYCDISIYQKNLLIVLLLILKYQEVDGYSIIKIDNMSYKVTLEIIYILSSIYEKVYIIKPNVSYSTAGYKYLVCCNYNPKSFKINEEMYNSFIQNITNTIMNQTLELHSLLLNYIPHYILSKLEEFNIIIHQQQLDSINTIINIFKNKKTEKLENMRKTNINKCIQWCDKNKIPYNNFIELTNIFYSKKKLDDNIDSSESELEEETNLYENSDINLDKFTYLCFENNNDTN